MPLRLWMDSGRWASSSVSLCPPIQWHNPKRKWQIDAPVDRNFRNAKTPATTRGSHCVKRSRMDRSLRRDRRQRSKFEFTPVAAVAEGIEDSQPFRSRYSAGNPLDTWSRMNAAPIRTNRSTSSLPVSALQYFGSPPQTPWGAASAAVVGA